VRRAGAQRGNCMGKRPTVTPVARIAALLLMIVLVILAAVGPTSWATPDQDAERQTVPTRTPTGGPVTPTTGPSTPTVGPSTPTIGPLTPTVGPSTPTIGPGTPASPSPTAPTATPSATEAGSATETRPSPPTQGGTAPPASESPADGGSETPPPESIASATVTASEQGRSESLTASPTLVAERSAGPATALPASTTSPLGPATPAEEGPAERDTASLPSLEAATATGAPLPAVRAWEDERRQRWVTVALLVVMAVLMLRRTRE